MHGPCAENVLLAEDAASGCCAKVTGYGLAHAKPLDVATSPNVVKGTEIAHWSPERLIDAHNTKVRRPPAAVGHRPRSEAMFSTCCRCLLAASIGLWEAEPGEGLWRMLFHSFIHSTTSQQRDVV